jgi:hypothetical protein
MTRLPRDHQIRALLAMPLAELMRHVRQCPEEELRRIYALGMVEMLPPLGAAALLGRLSIATERPARTLAAN